MWTPNYTQDLITDYSMQLEERETFMKEADFSTNLTAAEVERQRLVTRIKMLSAIKEGMTKCATLNNMDAYVDQKAYVYKLINEYKTWRPTYNPDSIDF
tara:strand:+ start:673 stop:969 length:297 start_codon:yes stop_codon:yes gene_type:complete